MDVLLPTRLEPIAAIDQSSCLAGKSCDLRYINECRDAMGRLQPIKDSGALGYPEGYAAIILNI